MNDAAVRRRRVTAAPKKRVATEGPVTTLTVCEQNNPSGIDYTLEVFVPPESGDLPYARTLTVPLDRANQYEENLTAFQRRTARAERMIAEATAEREEAYREFAAQTTWIGEQIRAEDEAADELREAQREAELAAERAELDARDAKLDKKYGPALWVYLPKLAKSRGRHGARVLRAWWMVHTATCQHTKEYRNRRPVVSGEELVILDENWEYRRNRVYGRARADMIAKVMKTPKVEWCGSCRPLELLNEKVPNWRSKEWK